ncbi:NADPH dehydrogenase [Rubripirellula amarantea]|uniref:NADPH dehydrogenase n=1 Tax=Rubripirellula amarantea TaxID=2527999 RepID=A0A5C5WKA8_9BACT|nr:NADH:flavin oxidoreductase [Rubripirellula amarantea]TWT51216.1 NADPH dehydrogenase [Rubripirellula amarantea]
MVYPRVASFKSHEDFIAHLRTQGLDLPCDKVVETGDSSTLGQSIPIEGSSIGNRFCILPMEGWDGTTDGKPTELTVRRWRNFGISGAKLIWGGEAAAVRHDGRANPNQLIVNDANASEIEGLRKELVHAHHEKFGRTDDLLVGLQLTHSGRWARPNDKSKLEPRTAQRNRLLDKRQGIRDDSAMLTDNELSVLVDDFVRAARIAESCGFEFVDVKHCHGYLGHELLSGVDRPGKYGGSFENRTRFLRDIVAGIRAEAPTLGLGVRVSIFDYVPYVSGADNIGQPDDGDPRLTFGGDGSGQGINLDEPMELMRLMEQLGIKLVCTTAGSPYYNPHIQRPAYFPPSDGYGAPEDPLVGVDRQIQATAQLKRAFPNLIFVGSGYTYLQEWLPGVGQAVVKAGMVDSIGLGRMVLSYPELPADVIAGTTMPRKKVCRTFSDCTTAPRKGMVSGCYPLDPYYKARPEREMLKQLKA